MKKIEVAPSILSANFARLEESIKEVSFVNYLHIDVMDGHFVPNITIGPLVVKAIRDKFDMIFDTHLMITNPCNYIKEFAEAGSDYITVHYEANNPLEAINLIKTYGKKAGISIKPNTSVEEIIDYLPLVDMVLVMSVEPGFGGQKFMPSAIDKISKLDLLKKQNNYDYVISVDGGINDITCKEVIEAGCDILVAGNYVFKSENKRNAIDKICEQSL